MRATLPHLLAHERKHGSVALGILHAPAPPASGSPLVSFRQGMGALPTQLASELAHRVVLGTSVAAIERGARAGFVLRLGSGTLEADGVVVATPAHTAAPLLDAISHDLARDLASVHHGPLACVTLAYDACDVDHPMDGTGFIVAPSEGRAVTSCTWSSRKWAGRAPEGTALLRCFIAPSALTQAASHGALSSVDAVRDQQLAALARNDLCDLMGITAPPRFAKVLVHRHGLPRYDLEQVERVPRMGALAGALGPLALAGNAHGGVGIPECIESGERAARAVLGALA